MLKEMYKHSVIILTDKDRETPLRTAIFEDEVTSSEQWHSIVKLCQDAGYDKLSIDILAALTLQGVMRNAETKAQEMEKTEEEKEREGQHVGDNRGKEETQGTEDLGDNRGQQEEEEEGVSDNKGIKEVDEIYNEEGEEVGEIENMGNITTESLQPTVEDVGPEQVI